MSDHSKSIPEGINEIIFVLNRQIGEVAEMQSELQEQSAKTRENSDRIEKLISRVSNLGGSLAPVTAQSIPVDMGNKYHHYVPDWNELLVGYCTDAQDSVNINDLLPDRTVADIDAIFCARVERERWERWGDFYLVAAAGLAGAVFDLILNNSVFNQPSIHNSIPHKGQPIDFPLGGGNYHRVIGPGHDLFRFKDARQMMVEGKWWARFRGQDLVQATYRYAGADKTYKCVPEDVATNALLMHWIADFFSKRSLPIPGWSYLVQEESKLADFALESYKNGMNLRMLVSNLSGVALTGVIIRIYFMLKEFIASGSVTMAFARTARYHEMCLAAHAVNVVTNIGKIAITQNVFAINIPALLAVVRHLMPVFWDIWSRSTTEGKVTRNRHLIDESWNEIHKLYEEEAHQWSGLSGLLKSPALVC